jgi:hypothetical protein
MADKISYQFALQQFEFGVAPDVLYAVGRFCRDADGLSALVDSAKSE